MDWPETEVWVKIVTSVVAGIAALVAIFKGIAELHRSTEQRKVELAFREREFRHKQALLARDFIKDVWSDTKARNALTMLDWLSNEYEDHDEERYTVQRDEIQHAMRSNPGDVSDKETFIRMQFEALYDYLEQLEKLIELTIIDFEDVKTTFRYYMVRVRLPEIRHDEFFKYYDYPNAEAFVARFDSANPGVISTAAS